MQSFCCETRSTAGANGGPAHASSLPKMIPSLDAQLSMFGGEPFGAAPVQEGVNVAINEANTSESQFATDRQFSLLAKY